MNRPVDADQRTLALDPARSFCVTAPAGSGKTELLSQRVLALLGRAQQPEEILAITFTRKAAAEMRQRIVAALRLAAEAPEPAEPHRRQTWQLARAALARDAELDWQLLRNPARLRLLTIDGLCSSLTAQMPVVSNFGAQPRIAEQAAPLYREAVGALLEGLEQSGPVADSLAKLLGHLDNQVERLQQLLMDLLARREQWLPLLGSGGAGAARDYLEATLAQIRGEALARAHAALLPYAGELVELLDFAAGQLAAAQPDHALAPLAGCSALPAPDGEYLEPWRALADWLLTGKDEWRRRLTVNEGFPAGKGADKAVFQERKARMQALLETFGSDAALRERLVGLRHLPAAAYAEGQWQVLAELTAVLPLAVAQLNLVFQSRGEVDFTQITLSALHALGDALDPSELLLRLDARIRHLLIDEFQDTSAIQFRLLQRLVEGWREHNERGGPPQTLFIVGDGMQSIYGFRQANVGLFLEARRDGVNGLELGDAPLSVNFRSTPTVIDWVNRVFAPAFPGGVHIARGAVPYEPSTAFNADTPDSEVAVYGLREDPDRSAEALRCVALVQAALQTDPEGSVAILVRYRSHLAAIVPALQRAGIAWRATDIDPLAGRAAVQDVLALLRALLDPADRIAWLALLRSPLVGLDNADLHAVAAGADGAGLRRTLWSRLREAAVRAALSAAGAAQVERAAAVLAAALQQRGRKPLRSWLEGTWLALGGPLALGGETDWRDLQVLLDLIETLAPAFTLEELERRLLALYARPEADLAARVAVMTIHKSKGLEFDTVIVPGLDRGTTSDDRALLQWGEYLGEDGATGLVLAARPALGGGDDAIYDYLDYERKQKQRLEDTRLLYVAATRAVRRLYLLFVSGAAADAEQVPAPPGNSLLARIWPGVVDSVRWGVGTGPEAAVRAAPGEVLYRVPEGWRAPALPAAAAAIAETEVTVADADTLETRVGTVIHRLLEQLVRYGSTAWTARSPQQQREFAAQLLAQSGVAAGQLPEAAAAVQQAVAATLADARGRWLLRADHQASAVEWELLAQGQRHVIDRSFVDADGVRWIVDYKSAMPRAGESEAAFVERQVGLYLPQLQTYRGLVAQLESRPIRTALYFPRLSRWQEVEA